MSPVVDCAGRWRWRRPRASPPDRPGCRRRTAWSAADCRDRRGLTCPGRRRVSKSEKATHRLEVPLRPLTAPVEAGLPHVVLHYVVQHYLGHHFAGILDKSHQSSPFPYHIIGPRYPPQITQVPQFDVDGQSRRSDHVAEERNGGLYVYS